MTRGEKLVICFVTFSLGGRFLVDGAIINRFSVIVKYWSRKVLYNMHNKFAAFKSENPLFFFQRK